MEIISKVFSYCSIPKLLKRKIMKMANENLSEVREILLEERVIVDKVEDEIKFKRH